MLRVVVVRQNHQTDLAAERPELTGELIEFRVRRVAGVVVALDEAALTGDALAGHTGAMAAPPRCPACWPCRVARAPQSVYGPVVGRVDEYRAELRALTRSKWQTYLAEHSGLPGPRGNIELAQAVAQEADPEFLDALIATGDEYLVFCGVVGLGQLLADGARREVEQRLRAHAMDERWRVREAVAMALQRLGDRDVRRVLDVVTEWADDTDPLVQRAAAAGVCEPGC